jgi:hypothetical protein
MPMYDRACDMAACLGLDEALLRRLEARGYLLGFDLSELEIRERLYHGHHRYLIRRSLEGAATERVELAPHGSTGHHPEQPVYGRRALSTTARSSASMSSAIDAHLIT